MEKILIPISIILILLIFFFLGTTHFGKQLASFSGIITARVTINPLEVEISAPSEVEIDKIFKVEARVINKGEEKIENSETEIFLAEGGGLVLIQKDPVKKIGVVPGKREKKISWQVRGEKIGNYVISVSALGELRGEIIRADGSAMVKVGEPFSRRGGQGWFQNLFDFFQEWFGF